MNCFPCTFLWLDARPSQRCTWASTMKYELPSLEYIGGSPSPWGCYGGTGLLGGEVEADVLGSVLGAGEQHGLVVEVDHPAVVRRADLLEDRPVELLAERLGEFGVVEVQQPLTVDADHRGVFGELDAIL